MAEKVAQTEKKKNKPKNTPRDEKVGADTSSKEGTSSAEKEELKPSASTFSARIRKKITALFTEQFLRISGLSLLLVSAYLSIAFVSYIFTWNADQDKVLGPAGELWFNPEVKVNNWLGKLGAWTSHQFIYNGFGIASFVFAFLAFITGLRLLLQIQLFKLGQAFRRSFFALVWISVCLGFIFHTQYPFLGGNFGFQMSYQLNVMIGQVGTVFLLLFSLLVFMVVAFNFSFGKNKPVPVSESSVSPAEEEKVLRNTILNPLNDQEPKFEVFNEEEEALAQHDIEEPFIVNNNEVEEEIPVEMPMDVEAPEIHTKAEGAGGVEFTIAEAKEEEAESFVSDTSALLEELGEYDPKLDLSHYKHPPLELLEEYANTKPSINNEELLANKDRIIETLKNYGIAIEKISATVGPTVTLYEIVPAQGVRISKIKNLEDDIALSLSALGIRIIAPMPGKGTIGIEVPNQNPVMVPMRSILASDKFQHSNMDLPVALGKTISNETFIADLAKMPHLLMAGATGQGKSVGLNAILVSLLYKKHPSQIKFVLVDPKKVELTLFNHIEKHFLAKLPDTEEPIITDTKKVVHTLNSLCIEMDNRYELLKDAQVRNLKEYNAKFVARKLNPQLGHRYLPYIVLVVDEFADLIMTAGKEVELPIARLAQLARAIGIHLIIATQRPSVNIITGTIKANFPARIAFRVTSKIDSRTILDAGGADQLIGRGDMLLSTGSDLIRLQCAFVDTPEVERITHFIGEQQSYPSAFLLPEFVDENAEKGLDIDDGDRDEFFEDAARIIVEHQQGSASLIQRRLKLGYNRAGRIIDQLEAAGIVGPNKGSKAREVLFKDSLTLEQYLKGNNQ